MPVWWGQTVSALNCSMCRAVCRCYARRVCMWCICVYVSAFATLLNTPLVLSDLALLASLASLQYRGVSFCSQGKAPASQICNADFTPRIKWHYSEGHPHSAGSDLNCTHVPLNFFFFWSLLLDFWSRVSNCRLSSSDHTDNHMWLKFNCRDEISIGPNPLCPCSCLFASSAE